MYAKKLINPAQYLVISKRSPSLLVLQQGLGRKDYRSVVCTGHSHGHTESFFPFRSAILVRTHACILIAQVDGHNHRLA